MSQRSSMAWLGYISFFAVSLGACVGTVDVGGGTSGDPPDPPGPILQANKIDLLLVVDNSRSMADKQEILARATADLVQSVTNPPCVDANGNLGQTPATPQDSCPTGQVRRHAPVADIHVGVISTSIGGHGSDSCPDIDQSSSCQPNANLTNNDKGHLLSRADACQSLTSVPTYQDQGFLAWDLNGTMSPPGLNDPGELSTNLATMVKGAGQIGCGYESQLESWYRFLVDPEPYESITVVNGNAEPAGTDVVLLQQRAQFLRPDSMLVILALTDENDCSINESGQYFFAAQLRSGGTPFHLPKPRSECATDPNDPCCKSCGEAQDNCPVDPTCTGPNGTIAMLTDAEDSINLRCFDQKRRFGIDFLYPVERYINALQQPTIANRAGELVANPIFSNLGSSNAPVRDSGLVFMATISGVPWQEIARTDMDLSQGFKNATEMVQDGTWNAVLGASGNAPTNPYMIESIQPRAGIPAGNIYNGGDRSIAGADDLQYACTFPLTTPRNCSDPSLTACDCNDPNNDNPLCAPDPNNNGARTMQVAAKAYPSPRTMRVVEGVGNQGILTSICPAQVDDASRADYAYRPVVRALVERMVTRL